MIQRKQNLYLALIIILCLVLSFSKFSIAELNLSHPPSELSEGDRIVMTYSNNFVYNGQASIQSIANANVQYILWCIALFALLGIISFKKLKRQITFSAFNFAFILFLPVFVYLDYTNLAKVYAISEIQIINTAIIPVALLLLNFLAVRGIVKDHNLIKSMDRIR